MSSFAMTVPYMRTSPLHIPRHDLVLGLADSLFLRVTVVDSDNPCAQAIELTGGIGGPVLQMTVWADSYYRNSWGSGGWGYDYRNSWDYGSMPLWQQAPVWTGLGVISDAPSGTFDIAFPTATMSAWPRRPSLRPAARPGRRQRLSNAGRGAGCTRPHTMARTVRPSSCSPTRCSQC